MIDFFKNWCKLRWARLGSWKRLYWRDTQAASKCVKHRRGQYSTTDGQEWIHHSVFQTRWVPNRRSRAIGWVVQGIWKACQIWKIYFGNLKEGFLQYILWQILFVLRIRKKYPWSQIIFQNDAKGRVMRIPSQTVQSEDDVDKSNHEKDPIFKDDTSKGILSLFCLFSSYIFENSRSSIFTFLISSLILKLGRPSSEKTSLLTLATYSKKSLERLMISYIR